MLYDRNGKPLAPSTPQRVEMQIALPNWFAQALFRESECKGIPDVVLLEQIAAVFGQKLDPRIPRDRNLLRPDVPLHPVDDVVAVAKGDPS